MKLFAAGDWIVIIAYLVGIIGLGVWLGRGQRSTRDYFLGGRDIPWWGVGFSILATETSALTFIGVPAASFAGDFGFIQIILGYVIARVVLAIVMVPHYFKGDIYSPYQLFQKAFGTGAKRTVAVFFLVSGVLAAGVRVYATCLPLEVAFKDVLPGDTLSTTIILFVGLSLVYTYFGGIRAVIWTDAVQFFLLVGGGIIALLFLIGFEGSGWTYLSENGSEKLKWFSSKFEWGMPYNIWMGVIGATFHVMSSHGVDQLNVQRVLACKSIGEGRKALCLSAILIFPMFLLFLFVGAFLWAYSEVHGLALPLDELGNEQTRYAFPVFILTAMPAGLKGLLVVGVCAAAMSSVSSALSALASVSVMDLLKELKPDKQEEWYLRFGKWSTLFWGAVLIGVAWACIGQDDLIAVAFSLAGLTSGAMLGGLILAMWWEQGCSAPIIAGMFSSLAVMIEIKLHTQIAWPWYTMIGTIVCLSVALIWIGANAIESDRRSKAEVAEGE